MEQLDFKIDKLETNADGGRLVIKGYASVFGNINSYGYTFDKGAFTNSIQRGGIKFLFNHNPDMVLGGFVELKEDDYGLYFEATCNAKVRQAQEVHALVSNGDLTGASIGFVTLKEATIDGVLHKQAVDLWEISIVTFPANELAVVEANSKNDALSSEMNCIFQALNNLRLKINSLDKFFC